MTSLNGYATTLIMSEHRNKLLIPGDFNIHMNDEFDENACNFMDIIMVLGLEQHIHFPTYKAGKTLDLVITELGSKLEVTKCSPGPFWLDHCAADFAVELPMYSIVQEACTMWVRKLCELDHEKLRDDITSVTCYLLMISVNWLVQWTATCRRHWIPKLHSHRYSYQFEPEFHGSQISWNCSSKLLGTGS